MKDFDIGKKEQFSENWFLAVQDRNYNTSSLCHYNTLVDELKTICRLNDLRNRIVHQASLDVYTLEAILIEEQEVNDLMENINKIVHAIIGVVKSKIQEKES